MKKKKAEPKEIKEKKIADAFNDRNKVNELERGMTVAIENLPESDLKNQLLMIAEKEARICIVAVQLDGGKWIAYSGYPDVKDLKIADTADNSTMFWNCEHIRTIGQVKMLGEQVQKNVAAILFPTWDINQYLYK
jgi:hypothetical protein